MCYLLDMSRGLAQMKTYSHAFVCILQSPHWRGMVFDFSLRHLHELFGVRARIDSLRKYRYLTCRASETLINHASPSADAVRDAHARPCHEIRIFPQLLVDMWKRTCAIAETEA